MGTLTLAAATAIPSTAATMDGRMATWQLAQVDSSAASTEAGGASASADPGIASAVDQLAGSVSDVAAVSGASEPNWWVLLGLIYLAIGLVAFAASVIGRGNWTDGTPDQLARAAQSHAFNVSGATFLALIGLAFQGVAQFATLAMGPQVVLLLLALMVLPLVHLLSADLFGDSGFDEGTDDDMDLPQTAATAHFGVAHLAVGRCLRAAAGPQQSPPQTGRTPTATVN